VARKRRIGRSGVTVDLVVEAPDGATWYVDIAGMNTGSDGGLRRTDAVIRCLGRGTALRGGGAPGGYLVLTPSLPTSGSEAALVLAAGTAAGTARVIDGVVDLGADDALDALSTVLRQRKVSV
jgi:hypothetical protein